ncbi:unnamed protein product [Owenia fusiformis]|uniref:Uncharacterized protein n=1 Tax=Owenia fusiformis TaxID=6347 RepID=A0A8J1U8L6_OWEFU|nr:unnamed protein product [Owenia fusiformis]
MADKHAQPQSSLVTIKNNYILQKLESIRNDEAYRDLTIVCKYGAILRAHKLIVAKYSSVLKNMINSKRKTAAVRIDLNDLDSEQIWEPWMVEIVLDFMYGKVIELAMADLKPVIEVAVKLNVPEFLLACQDILSMNDMLQSEKNDTENAASPPKSIKIEPLEEVSQEISSTTNKSKGINESLNRQLGSTLELLHDHNPLGDNQTGHNNRSKDNKNSEGIENEEGENDEDITNDENEADDEDDNTFEVPIEQPQKKIVKTSREVCKFCGEESASKAELADHLLEKHDLSACPTCLKMFENQTYLEKHIETHTKPVTNRSARKKATLSALRVISLIEKAYNCSECDAQLSSYGELAIHLNEAHDLIACNICAKVFSSVGHLGRHKVLHSEKILVAGPNGLFLYNCHHCQDVNDKLPDGHSRSDTTFQNISEFYSHQNNAHGGLKCRTCSAKKAKLIRLCDHILRMHIKEKLFECDECDQHFPTLESRSKHKLYRKEGHCRVRSMGSMCEHCGRSFKSRKGLDVHMEEKHAPTKDFTCPECNKSFSSETLCQTHIKTRHGERSFMCDECGKSFYRQGLLNCHIATVHKPEVLKTNCEHCKTEFPNKRLRLKHIRRTPECRKALNMYNIQCPICEKEFCRQVDIDMHMDKVHSGEEFVCDECGRKYETIVKLKKHKKEHLRLHECSVCSKRFGDRKHLVDHARIHTGVRPYKCLDCGKAFTQSASLYKHKQSLNHKQGVEKNQSNTGNDPTIPDAEDEISIVIPAQHDKRPGPQLVQFVQLLSATEHEFK